MSLKYRIIVAILVCAVASVALVSAPLYVGTQRLIAEGSARELEQSEARLRAGLEARVQTALTMAQTIAAIPRVQRAVEKADTKGLHRLFVKDFPTLSAKTGVAQFQFHTPQAISILRVHRADKYGDDLSGFRKTVVRANQEQTAVAGLERGRAGLGIRGISPVTDDDEHLGTVEIGLRFDDSLLDTIMQGSDSRVEVYFLPDAEIDEFETGSPETPRISGNYDGPALLTPAELQSTLDAGQQTTTRVISDAGFSGTTFAINDFSGHPVAIGHVLVPNESYATISHNMMMLSVGVAIAAIALSAGMAWIFGARLTNALCRVIKRLQALSGGDVEVPLDDLPTQGEMGQLAEALTAFRDSQIEAADLREARLEQQENQTRIVDSLASALRNLAQGDLKTRIDGDFGDGYQQLVTDFNAAASGLAEVISAISGVAARVSENAEDLRISAVDLSTRSENSAATLEETAAALEQVTGNVRLTSDEAQNANAAGNGAIAKARSGADIVASTVKAMSEIDDSAGEIARITGLIDEIAFQTNLLALNAGVEAARAGAAGSGFAVVASEVQALARRTADAAGQIGSLIVTSGEKVQHGVVLVNKTGTALDEIVTAVEAVTEQINHIADLAAEQQQSLSDVNVSMTELDRTTQQNAAVFQETIGANQVLLEQGTRLGELVGQFANATQGQAHGLTEKAA